MFAATRDLRLNIASTVSPTPIAADGECHHLVFIASDDLSGPHKDPGSCTPSFDR